MSEEVPIVRGLRTLARLLCTAGVLAVPAVQASPPIPLEIFAAGPHMAEPHLSPDGGKLVYLTSVAGQLRIAVRNLKTGSERSILNAAAGPFSVTHCEFKTNDRLLCHLEGVARGGDPERLYPASRLLAVDADGGSLRMLFRDSFFARLPPAARSQFQDRIVHWLPGDAYHVLIELGDAGSVFPSVYRLDVYRGDLKLVVPSQPPIMDWTADPAGVVRFGYGFRDDTGVYIARSGPDAPWRTLEEFKRFDRTRFDPLAFGARANELLVFAPYQRRTAVWQIDLDAPAKPLTLLFWQPDVDVGGILEWPLDRHVAGFVYETDRPHTHFIDPRAARIEETLARALPGAYHVVVDSSRDESKFVTVSFSDVMPPRYDLLDTATGSLTELGRQDARLNEAQLAHVKPITVPGAGGIAIPGYLTLPPGSTPGQRLPAVVLPHGGPYARDRWGYDPLVQVIASRGYAVLQLNFRGSTGYGEQWRDAGHQAWGTIMHADITAGAHWLIEQGIADPARLAIVGWSYGGYAALTGVEKEPELYRCAVSIAGVSDMSQMARDDERFYGGKDSAGDAMGTDPAALRAESPLQHVERIRVPVLLVHGEDDYTVLAEQSKAMDRALSKQGLPHELVLIRHGEHSLVRPEMRLLLYQKLTEFLRANLGPGQSRDSGPVLISGAAATQ